MSSSGKYYVSNVWKDARKIVSEKKIVKIGEGNDRTFYKVAEVPIEMHKNKSGFKFICTCQHCSVYAGFEPFCSHKAALITQLVVESKCKN